MNHTIEPKPQEINLWERAVETLSDHSLPAAQAINDADAAQTTRRALSHHSFFGGTHV